MWTLYFSTMILYELTCEEDELLSRAVARGLQRGRLHRALIYGFTAVTVGHLLQLLSPRVDPYHGFDRVHINRRGSKV